MFIEVTDTNGQVRYYHGTWDDDTRTITTEVGIIKVPPEYLVEISEDDGRTIAADILSSLASLVIAHYIAWKTWFDDRVKGY